MVSLALSLMLLTRVGRKGPVALCLYPCVHFHRALTWISSSLLLRATVDKEYLPVLAPYSDMVTICNRKRPLFSSKPKTQNNGRVVWTLYSQLQQG